MKIIKSLIILYLFSSCSDDLKLLQFEGEADKGKILSSLFPDFDQFEQDKGKIYKLPLRDSVFNYFPNNDSLFVEVRDFKEVGDNLSFIMIIYSFDNDCHNCGPLIGLGSYLRLKDKYVLKSFRYIEKIGTFGRLPNFSFIRIGKNNEGILFSSPFLAQGYYSESIILYAYFNDFFTKALHVENVACDNSGMCDSLLNNCWKYKYKLKTIQNEKHFWDIEILRYGTISQNHKVVPLNEQKVYCFVNGLYKLCSVSNSDILN